MRWSVVVLAVVMGGASTPSDPALAYAKKHRVYADALAKTAAAASAISREERVAYPSERHPVVAMVRIGSRASRSTAGGPVNVLLTFDVSGAGRVGNIRTEQSHGGSRYAAYAANSAALWLYEPAREGEVGYTRTDEQVEMQFETLRAGEACQPFQPRFPGTDEAEQLEFCESR